MLEGMAQTAGFWSPRASLDPEGHMGPLVSKEQHERVMGYIEAGKRDGASVVMGGDVPASDGGYYVNPTILVDVNPQMSVVREEIFGPVVVAQRFDDLDEVAKDGQRHRLRPRRQRVDPGRQRDAQARQPASSRAPCGAIATR